MKGQRFTSTSAHDFSITSKVRTVLMEGGHYDLVTEQLVDALRDIETMARQAIKEHGARLQTLENAERERLTQSGVITMLDARAGQSARDWLTWGLKNVLPWTLALIAGGFAWKGYSK